MSCMSQYSRRKFLSASAVAAGVGVVGQATSAHAQSSGSSVDEFFGSSQKLEPTENPGVEIPFGHGVASGDPTDSAVILWTRVTPTPEALPGSGVGDPVTVEWTVARDEELSDVVATGTAETSAAIDHTVHVDATGLEPDTVYFYGFRVADGEHAGKTSPVGRTWTAPAAGTKTERLNAVVASCANWESGFFSAYRDISARARAGEIDLVIFLGDYIYEYGRGEYVGKRGAVRNHEPAHEILDLADYRIRYGTYRTDADLQAAHGACPWVVVWDDHEVANNAWRDGAENHTEGAEGRWVARQQAAMQAYYEWLPIRATSPSAGGKLYRKLAFGDLVDLTMMDLRTYRDEEQSFGDWISGDLNETMMGSEQFGWVAEQARASKARWLVMGNSIMFSPMTLLGLRDNPDTSSVADFLSGRTGDGLPLNGDQWDGYSAERDRLLDVLDGIDPNILFVTGDIHSEWAHSVRHDGHEIGAELICSSISAPNVDEMLKLPVDNALSHAAESVLRHENPHVQHVDLDAHGYALAEITPDHVDMSWMRVADLNSPGSAVDEALRMRFTPGHGWS